MAQRISRNGSGNRFFEQSQNTCGNAHIDVHFSLSLEKKEKWIHRRKGVQQMRSTEGDAFRRTHPWSNDQGNSA